MLEQTIRKCRNRSIDAAKVILELIELAGEMREAHKRREQLSLTEEELSFYNALEINNTVGTHVGMQLMD